LILEGNGNITFENHSEISAVKGDAILIPYSAGSWTLNGASGVVCRPPLAKDAPLAW
jgi:mannose-6-phosphate isomerase